MTGLLVAYLELLVADAAHALAGSYTQHYPESYCNEALGLLQTGQEGRDLMVDAAAVVTGYEPDFLYRALLGQARTMAAKIKPGFQFSPQCRVA